MTKPILSSDHASIQHAVDAAITAGRPLVINQPLHSLTQPIQIYGTVGVNIVLTGILRAAANMDSVFDVVGSTDFALRGGHLQAGDGVEVERMAWVRNDANITSQLTKRPYVGHVKMSYNGTGNFGTGVEFNATNMLDEGLIERVGVGGRFGSTDYGIRIVGNFGNNTQHILTGCYANDCGIGYSIEQVNVVSLRGCNADGGAPDSGGGSVAYFVNSLNCHISDCRAEAYQKLLASGGPSTAMAKMRLTNVDYAAQEMDSEDVNVIDWKYAGLLVLDGVTIGEPAAEPRIKLSSSAICRLSGVVQVYGANNRPAAADLVDGENVSGSLVYQQGDSGPAMVGDEVISFDV